MRIFECFIRIAPAAEPKTVPAPGEAPRSFEEMAATGLRHGRYITGSIGELLRTAAEAEDHRTQSFLPWSVNGQTEEENARGMLDALGGAAGCRAVQMNLDEKTGGREV